MSKLFTCDNCGKTFPQAIEEERYRDEHGEWHSLDLCAPCKNLLEGERKGLEKKFFTKILEKIK